MTGPQKRSDSQGRGLFELEEVILRYLDLLEEDGPGPADAYRRALPASKAAALDHRLRLLDAAGLAGTAGEPPGFGPFRILRRIGRGGQADVYLAEQLEPVRRQVALKLPLPASGRRLLLRSLRERELLAGLDHEGIAKLYEAGIDERGQPWFSMEYVDGPSIVEFCARHRLDLVARLRLVIAVCAAVEHAHQRGIHHRDLTPNNILVAGTPVAPRPKIIDFGLARQEAGSLAATTRFTVPGQPLGTLRYASPEAAAGLPDLDARADVYGLGAVLYELMTGSPPQELPADMPLDEAVRAVREREPVLPSLRVTRAPPPDAGAWRLRSPRQLRSQLSGDLDAVVMKALAKDRARRFASVGALRRNLENVLLRRPVDARRHTRGYLLLKFIDRHRLGASSAAVLLLVLLGSGLWIATSEIAASERLDEFQSFGLARRLRSLDESERAAPVPATSATSGRLAEWIGEVEWVLAQRPRLEQKLQRLRAALEVDASDGTFQEGRAARLELVDAIEDTLARAEEVEAADGTLTQARIRLGWTRDQAGASAGSASPLWAKVDEELARDPRFAGVTVAPRPGLVPLGRDPATGLQEFAFTLPGSRLPRRLRANGVELGNFDLDADSAIVFVLVPGGTVMLGSQNEDPDQPNFDPARGVQEPGLRLATIEPFLVGKYELTRGQWQKLVGQVVAPFPQFTGANSGIYPAAPVAKLYLDHALGAWQLRLPTMSEWEYAARGHTGRQPPIPWWSRELDALKPFVNIADQALRLESGKPDDDYELPWNDGFPVMAPVNSMEPNPFGLWHVLGNVNELCTEPGRTRLCGGSWHQGWRRCRPTHSTNWQGEAKETIGVRLALSLQ